MKPILSVLLAMTVAASSIRADDREARLAKGTELHDRGNYDAAIEVYRGVLEDYPHDATAVYELAFSWMSRGTEVEDLVPLIETELASGHEQHPALPLLLGWAYDHLGRYTDGEAAMRRAFEALPDSPIVHYNLGVNLSRQKRWPEAGTAFEEALRLDPGRISAWFGLAECQEALDRPTRALLAGARAAAIEPDSERGHAMAAKLWSFLFAGIELTDPGGDGRQTKVSITIPAAGDGEEDGSDSDEIPPDPESMERISMSVVAAGRHLEKWEDKSDARFFADALDSVTTILSELDLAAQDPFWSLVLPWFDAARKDSQIETLAYVLRASAGDSEGARWTARHAKAVRSFQVWLAAQD